MNEEFAFVGVGKGREWRFRWRDLRGGCGRALRWRLLRGSWNHPANADGERQT